MKRTDEQQSGADTGGLRQPAGKTSVSWLSFVPMHAEVVYALPTRTREIALTFDDGPNPHYTPQVLRVLRQYGVQATFFIRGDHANAFPNVLQDIADHGHVVANHSWSHPHFTQLSPAAVRSELGRTSSLIEKMLGAAPTLARAPYGAWDQPSLNICRALGMTPVGWSIDSLDWTCPGVAPIISTITNTMKPGAIVLSHDGGGSDRSQTVAALKRYLPRLLDMGYIPTCVPQWPDRVNLESTTAL